jgi:hypothetical protein
MKMLGQAHQAFIEADLAYRRERVTADAEQVGARKKTGTWRQRLRDALRDDPDQPRGIHRRGPRPIPAPNH